MTLHCDQLFVSPPIVTPQFTRARSGDVYSLVLVDPDFPSPSAPKYK